jgi:hypothetical protein
MLCPLDSDAEPGVPVALVVANGGSTPTFGWSKRWLSHGCVPVDALATVRHRAVTDTPRSQ